MRLFRFVRLAVFSFLLVLGSSSLALAAGTVGTGTPGSCTEAALDTALTGGGLVDFDCGVAPHTITITAVKVISASTTVDGGNLITLDGNNAAYHFFATGANGLTIQNITLENGNSGGTSGGSIHMDTGTLTITNSTLQNNTSGIGGGTLSSNGDVNITDSTISGGSTVSSGGVMFVNGGTITVDNVIFDQNTGSNGGGVFRIDSGTVNVIDSIFTQNSSSGANGTVFQINGGGTVTVDRSVFENNAISDRPVIENGGVLTINRSAFVNNLGIPVSSNATLTMTNVTIGDNAMAGNFGAVYLFGSGVTNIYNSTIVNNSKRGLTAGGTVTLLNTVVANNALNDCVGTITSLGGNLDSDGTCGLIQVGDVTGLPQLNALSTVNHDDTSGTTRVYEPMTGSPLIDGGVLSGLNPSVDQRGVARPVDGNGDMTIVIDKGAFEVSAAVDTTAPMLVEVTPVTTPDSDATPNYTFSSDEGGTITYGGACLSTTTVANVGNNTITFDTLTPATYSNCTITVTDASANASMPLAVSSFEITAGTVQGLGSSGSGGGSSGGGCVHISCLLKVQEKLSEDSPSVENDSCAGYSDLTADDPSCEAITYAQSIGAMTGNDDGTFGAEEFLQRDQIVKISLEAFGLFDSSKDYCEGSQPFPDVASSSWSYQYICRGKQLGMITGYESGENVGLFVAADNVILVEFWALLLRNIDEAMPLGPSFNGWLSDAWYSGYAQYVAANSLYEGLPSPVELVPRRDVAVFLYELHLMGAL